jgi:hypothetical protein
VATTKAILHHLHITPYFSPSRQISLKSHPIIKKPSQIVEWLPL